MMKILTSIALLCSGRPSIVLDDNPLIEKFFKIENFSVVYIVIKVNLEEGHGFFSLITRPLTDFKGGGGI